MDHQRPHFLFLPREIRDLIYYDYLRMGTEDGYTYDFEAGKLRTADKQPVDLSLMYTCRLVANEMRGLPLRLHRITFTTLYSDELRFRAGRWAYLMYLAEQTLYDKIDDVARRMSPEMVREVAQRYGETFFYRLFQRMRYDNGVGYGGGLHWGSQDLCMSEETWTIEDFEPRPLRIIQPIDFAIQLNMIEQPWRIPTDAEMDAIVKEGFPHWPDSRFEEEKMSSEYWKSDRGKYRFSAAAAAIHFLESVPDSTRRQIRNITLLEDRVSVAIHACHAKGLVSFCLENRDLCIERRVNLWRNLFLGSRWAEHYGHDLAAWVERDTAFEVGGLTEEDPTMPVAEWTVEASLPILPDAISLFLDGDPTPEQIAEVFRNRVQKDAAWQKALDKAFVPGRSDDENVFDRRCGQPWHFERFPELLEAMCNNEPSSRVRCNFDPGSPWDEARVDEIVAAKRGRVEAVHWRHEWAISASESPDYLPAPPLPSWQDLLKENLLPEA